MFSKEYFITCRDFIFIASPIAWFATNIWLAKLCIQINLNLVYICPGMDYCYGYYNADGRISILPSCK